MFGEAICLGLFICFGAAIIGGGLIRINYTLERIIARWAALENLGLFPEEDDEQRS